jgi:hypothetical protein
MKKNVQSRNYSHKHYSLWSKSAKGRKINSPKESNLMPSKKIQWKRSKATFPDWSSHILEQDIVLSRIGGECNRALLKQIALLSRNALEAGCAFVQAMEEWRKVTRLALLNPTAALKLKKK